MTTICDTVGEMIEKLQQFPADAPITASYTGDGRVGVISSSDGADETLCVAVYTVSEQWLHSNNLPLVNPKVSQE